MTMFQVVLREFASSKHTSITPFLGSLVILLFLYVCSARSRESHLPQRLRPSSRSVLAFSVIRQAPGSWHPRGQPASLTTGNRLGAREVPST
eukprot:656252-Prymnesium_polylepis.1